jgi:hypothetical protein
MGLEMTLLANLEKLARAANKGTSNACCFWLFF